MIVLIAVLLILVVASVLVGNYFYAFALTPRRGERAPGVPEGEIAGTTDSAHWRQGDWLDEHAVSREITSDDGLRLKAHFVGLESNRYAIVVHGYTGNGRTMAGFGRKFHERGFNVLLPDCRGHGESEGDYIGMGWHDRLDVLRWIDMILAENAEAEILLFGISMGGATVMMAAGEPLPEQVKLVIEDCGYTSVWDEFSVQLRGQFGLPSFPVLNIASLTTKVRAGFSFTEADAVRQLKKSKVPMLFIHGDADTFVPFSMLDTLYEAKPGDKEKLVVADAGHGGAFGVDPEGYWAAVDAAIDRYMGGMGL